MGAIDLFMQDVVELSDKVVASFMKIRGNRKITDKEIERMVDWVIRTRYESIVIDLIEKELVCVDIDTKGEMRFTMTSDGTELYDIMYSGDKNGCAIINGATASESKPD